MASPDLGSFTNQVQYDDPYTAHLLAYDEANAELFAAIEIMAAMADKQDHQFTAMGATYTVTRNYSGKLLVTRSIE